MFIKSKLLEQRYQPLQLLVQTPRLSNYIAIEIGFFDLKSTLELIDEAKQLSSI